MRSVCVTGVTGVGGWLGGWLGGRPGWLGCCLVAQATSPLCAHGDAQVAKQSSKASLVLQMKDVPQEGRVFVCKAVTDAAAMLVSGAQLLCRHCGDTKGKEVRKLVRWVHTPPASNSSSSTTTTTTATATATLLGSLTLCFPLPVGPVRSARGCAGWLGASTPRGLSSLEAHALCLLLPLPPPPDVPHPPGVLCRAVWA